MPISICKHGAPFVVQHENRYGSGASQSSSLSKSIRHISNSHEEIKFISCYSANGACFSNAQMLANASGRPVIGYYGKINKLTASLDNSGRIFRPQHKLAANICYSNSLSPVSGQRMRCHRSSCAWAALNLARASRASSASPTSVSYREAVSGNASAHFVLQR